MITQNKSKLGRKYNTARHDHKKQPVFEFTSLVMREITPLPAKTFNGLRLVPCWDQGPYGTCYSHAVARCIVWNQIKYNIQPFKPSITDIAWKACVQEGENTVAEDQGISSIPNAIIPLLNQGYCPEWIWPYNSSTLNIRPTPACVAEALKHMVDSYAMIPQDLDSIKRTLANGNVIAFGALIYPQYESNQCLKDGIVEMPEWIDRHIKGPLGGHAQTIVDYDDTYFYVDGSWGTNVGATHLGDMKLDAPRGIFKFPYDYILSNKLAFDFCVVNGVSEVK